MKSPKILPWLGGLLLCLLGAAVPAFASPWAEVGDNQLRADIEILAAAGVIDDVTTQWPLPWTSIVRGLEGASLAGQPQAVQAAAQRVLARAESENRPGLSGQFTLDATNDPSVVHGFDSLDRGEGQSQVALSYSGDSTSARLAVGAYTDNFRGHGTKLMLDNSYVAQKVGDALLYGGWLDQWWGPGWISALSLSNNARPMPQIGIERNDTSASTWPILEWLGPWQGQLFVGELDGPRQQKYTLYNALRFTFNPAPGLQIGLARTEEFCGETHPCVPLRDYFDLQNDPQHVDKTNDEGLIDIKYSHEVWGVPAEAYMQLMNEDSSPFTHSGTSHLFGTSVYLPVTWSATPLRLTAEYADSVSTEDMFSFGDDIYGFSYTNGGYPDGMRYRGRTLGFSLDDDSRLLSLQAAWSDDDGRFYELTFHHANIGSLHSVGDNIVSATPVLINMGEARLTLPFAGFKLDLAARLQDDQPRPDRGFTGGFEAALRVPF